MKGEIITPAQCLRDHDFQDSLVEFNFMKRRSIQPGDLALNTRSTTRVKPQSTHIAGRIVEQLAESSGYIVPREDVAKNIYGSTDHDSLQRIAQWWSVLQHMILYPENFLHKNNLGYAVGVSDMKLSGENTQILYTLWLNMWNFVSLDELAQSRYGIVDDSGKRSVSYAIMDLNKHVLPETGLDIRTRRGKRTNVSQYQLTDEKEGIYFRDFLPPFLDFAFQDWLSRDDVLLLQRSTRRNELSHASSAKKDTKYSIYETKIVEKLKYKPGYIIPYSYFSTLLYDHPDEITNIGQLINGLREKLVNPQDIFTANKIGLATGIDALHLNKLKLQVLHLLWMKQGEFIAGKDMLFNLYGKDTKKPLHNVSREISEINHLLVPSQYEIVTNALTYGFIKTDCRYSLRKK